MVKGPARVAVRGRCLALGADVSNSDVIVRRGKALPFEPEGRCRLYVRLGRKGRAWWADPCLAGALMWKDVATTILSSVEQRDNTLVMLAGESDTGKSTLCTYLANMSLARNILPWVIDGDIGQGDIAPPSAIGAAMVSQQITDLRDLSASLFEFVGVISAAGVEHLICCSLRSICNKLRNHARLLLVNTDGYVRDGGLRYKRMLADEIQPDMIISMGVNEELVSQFALGTWQVIRAKSSVEAQKTRYERKWRRYTQFHRFTGKGLVRASLDRVNFRYLGKTVLPSDPNSILTLYQDGNIENVFVGLGSDNRIIGFGIVKSIDRGYVELQTDVTDFDTVHLGNIRLARGMAEQIILQMPGRVSPET